jgi:hypothetical protein
VTSNGLCDSHGHCAYDTANKKPYCYCNTGYYGSSCSSTSYSSTSTYDGFSVELGLLITLLIIALLLTSGVVFMAWRIHVTKTSVNSSSLYSSLPGGPNSHEMTETVNF